MHKEIAKLESEFCSGLHAPLSTAATREQAASRATMLAVSIEDDQAIQAEISYLDEAGIDPATLAFGEPASVNGRELSALAVTAFLNKLYGGE